MIEKEHYYRQLLHTNKEGIINKHAHDKNFDH